MYPLRIKTHLRFPLLLVTFLLINQFLVTAQKIVTPAAVSANGLVPNLGQWAGDFNYRFSGADGSVFLDDAGLTYSVYDKETYALMSKEYHTNRILVNKYTLRQHSLKLSFNGLGEVANISGANKFPFYHNYFLGNDPTDWRGKVPVYQAVNQQYNSGAVVKYQAMGTQFKYDIVLPSGFDISQVSIGYSGHYNLTIKEGNLVIATSVQNIIESIPEAYQIIKGKKVPVKCSYVLKDDKTVGFIASKYNNKYPLVIDPVLVFATYSGSVGDNFGYTAAFDSKGCLYAGGIEDNISGAYPVTAGAFQTKYGGRGPVNAPVFLPCDATISKYNPTGSALLYATYLGGSNNEYPHSLVVDANDNLVILGTTLSKNFPVMPKGFDTSQNGAHDLYVVKLTADGSTMMGGTYLGGSLDDGINSGSLHYNYADDFRGDVLTDDSGYIYVATCTKSANFPVTAGAQQKNKDAALDGVVMVLNPDIESLRWSTFYGGESNDAAYSIKLDDSARLFVGGGTSSADLPMFGNGLNKTYLGGTADGYIVRIDRVSGNFLQSTFWGTDEYDQVYFLDFDPQDKIYITGQTEGKVARTPGTYGDNNATQFIARLNNELTTQEFATTFGNRPDVPQLSPSAFMVDYCYNIYFSGWGSDVGAGNPGTTTGLELSANAIQKTTDGSDFYLYVLGKDAKFLQFASFMGGNQSDDHVDGGTSRFDKQGLIYQSVCSSCPPNGVSQLSDFPTSPGAVFKTNPSIRCSNASFKIDFQFTYAVEAIFTVTPKNGCTPINTVITNLSKHGKAFQWDFGDGTTSTQKDPVHTYPNTGKYTIRLVSIDSGSCNISDTAYQEIELLEGPLPSFEYDYEPCTGILVLKNTSTRAIEPLWDLGNGDLRTGDKVRYSYPNTGNYKITLKVKNPNSPCIDSIVKNISISTDSLQKVSVPNVFTPNADPFNPGFKINGITNECDKVNMKIYDRWGVLIFKTTNPNEYWNGKVLNTGADCTEGTYYYVANVTRKDGQKLKISGPVLLLR